MDRVQYIPWRGIISLVCPDIILGVLIAACDSALTVLTKKYNAKLSRSMYINDLPIINNRDLHPLLEVPCKYLVAQTSGKNVTKAFDRIYLPRDRLDRLPV